MMAGFFKKKPRDTSEHPSRQFYVEFLGCLPCRGTRGSIHTKAVAHDLIQKKNKFPDVPKMTLQVSQTEIKISNNNSEEHRMEKITSVKYPCIMMKNVTFVAAMGEPHTDIVTCIYNGYNPVTQCVLHTHVYQFDYPSTATTFVNLLNKIVETPQHQEHISQLEEHLRHKGFLQASVVKPPPPASFLQKPPQQSTKVDIHHEECKEPERETYISPERQTMQAMTSELKQKLRLREAPLLLPPKDYDTIHRKHGRLNDISSRKCLNELLVGRTAVEAAVSASGDTSLLSEQDESQETNEAPIVYPPKQPSDNDLVYPTNSAVSPPILRKQIPYRRRQRESNDSSFVSNSSGGSDRNYRASYTPPSPSSPQPVINQRHRSAYEAYPTLKSPDRNPVVENSTDMSTRSNSHHTRENSMSSSHSALSSHSDPSQMLSQILNEADLEIPPDYDQSPNDWEQKDEPSGYSNQFGNNSYYGHPRSPGNQGASMEDVYPHSPTNFQSAELYSKPIKRITAVQRRNGGLPN